MACCKKRRNQQTKKIMKRRLFEADAFRSLARLKDQNPITLQNKLLLDYHKKTHMLYAGALKHKPVNKAFINRIVEMHDEYVREILKRGIDHKTPLQRA